MQLDITGPSTADVKIGDQLWNVDEGRTGRDIRVFGAARLAFGVLAFGVLTLRVLTLRVFALGTFGLHALAVWAFAFRVFVVAILGLGMLAMPHPKQRRQDATEP
jgi:hypothetical protein